MLKELCQLFELYLLFKQFEISGKFPELSENSENSENFQKIQKILEIPEKFFSKILKNILTSIFLYAIVYTQGVIKMSNFFDTLFSNPVELLEEIEEEAYYYNEPNEPNEPMSESNERNDERNK